MILAFFLIKESLCGLIVIKLQSPFEDKSIKDTYVNQKAKRLFFHKSSFIAFRRMQHGKETCSNKSSKRTYRKLD